ncbi:MAG: ABC transporter substrate-binding protein [Acidimicrobiia bacterium]
MYRIGWLGPASPTTGPAYHQAFRQQLHDLGWIEGQNLIIEGRYAEGRTERLPDLAAELVRLKPDVILTISSPGAQAAQNATRTIPIVFTFVTDPVEQGFVTSLARPGGNITGVVSIFPEVAGKWLELLKETIPGLSRVAFLWDARNPGIARVFQHAQVAAQTLSLTLQSMAVRDPNDFEPAFSAMIKERAEALVEFGGGLTIMHRRRIADLALKHRLPTMFFHPLFVQDGGLMAYAANYPAMFRRAASLVDKILKGGNPADLPVERPTEWQLVINMKTAKALGLTLPPSVLVRADRLIE